MSRTGTPASRAMGGATRVRLLVPRGTDAAHRYSSHRGHQPLPYLIAPSSIVPQTRQNLGGGVSVRYVGRSLIPQPGQTVASTWTQVPQYGQDFAVRGVMNGKPFPRITSDREYLFHSSNETRVTMIRGQ